MGYVCPKVNCRRAYIKCFHVWMGGLRGGTGIRDDRADGVDSA